MKNFEKYEKEIKAITDFNEHFGMRNGMLVGCRNMQCNECDWHETGCIHSKWDWLYEDYKETLLAEEERKYLKDVIRIYDHKNIKGVVKNKAVIPTYRIINNGRFEERFNEEIELDIAINEREQIVLPLTEDKFKNLVEGKRYSLKELGL